MISRYALSCILAFLFLSQPGCKKSNDPVPVPEPPPATGELRLKDYVVSNLPSPYYSFDYSTDNRVSKINFASSLFQYSLSYEAGKLTRLVNEPNGDRLEYRYLLGRVSSIEQFESSAGRREWSYQFTYDPDGKLTIARWFQIVNNGADSIARRVALLSYQGENLIDLFNFRENQNGELALSSHINFGNFDDKTNVESFGLLKDFFEHLLFLPGVTLQKNNPRISHILGEQSDFEVQYTYTYQSTVPVSKISRIEQVRGTQTGKVTVGNTVYHYF